MSGSPASSAGVGRPAPRHVLFDLDDTLYPAATGFFRLVSSRIHVWVQREFGWPPAQARAVQRRYWRRYGTSLRGLMVRHGVEPAAFLEFVHDVPVEEHLSPQARVREALLSIGARRHVFTNGPAAYASRVLRALEIEDLFDEIFDIERGGWEPKPSALPYDRVQEALGARGGEIVLIEDSPRNLIPARERGWRTIWLRPSHDTRAVAPGFAEPPPSDTVAERVIDRIEDVSGALRELGVPIHDNSGARATPSQ